MVQFDIGTDGRGRDRAFDGSLLVNEPMPDAALVGHLRKRLNELINANLRYTYGN